MISDTLGYERNAPWPHNHERTCDSFSVTPLNTVDVLSGAFGRCKEAVYLDRLCYRVYRTVMDSNADGLFAHVARNSSRCMIASRGDKWVRDDRAHCEDSEADACLL